jgi:DNA-binding transcriptional ArsR family regulator
VTSATTPVPHRGTTNAEREKMPSSRRPALVHPEMSDVSVYDVLHALADATRLTIVKTLREDSRRACGTFPVSVSPSTLTHHFRVLREAGVIVQTEDGNRKWTSLRQEDLDERFPGLLDAVLQVADAPG